MRDSKKISAVVSIVRRIFDEHSLNAQDRSAVLASLASAMGPLVPKDRVAVEALLARHGSMTRAAAELGCSTRTLQLRMRELGIPPMRSGVKRHDHR